MTVRRQQSHPSDKRINRESLRAADGRRVVVLAVHKLAAPSQAIFCGDFFTVRGAAAALGGVCRRRLRWKAVFLDGEIWRVKQNCVLFYDNEVMKT